MSKEYFPIKIKAVYDKPTAKCEMFGDFFLRSEIRQGWPLTRASVPHRSNEARTEKEKETKGKGRSEIVSVDGRSFIKNLQ